MKTLFKRTVLFALVAALGMASLPFVRVSAAGAYDPPVPPQGQLSNDRLERIWARQLRLYERLGNGFERKDIFIDRVQTLIDRAKAKGKDVSAVQAALDAFEAALKKAQPIYESTKGIVSSHQGFDENGKVTDPVKAQATIESLRGKFKEIKDAMNGTGKALREAIRAFREANPPSPRGTPTPASQ
jgi:hypothetical protein